MLEWKTNAAIPYREERNRVALLLFGGTEPRVKWLKDAAAPSPFWVSLLIQSLLRFYSCRYLSP